MSMVSEVSAVFDNLDEKLAEELEYVKKEVEQKNREKKLFIFKVKVDEYWFRQGFKLGYADGFEFGLQIAAKRIKNGQRN